MIGRGALRVAFSFLARNKLAFAAAMIFRSLWEVVPMQVPVLAGIVVDGLTNKPASFYGLTIGGSDPSAAMQFAFAGLAAVAAIFGLSAYAYTMTGTRLGQNFVADLRKRVAEKIMILSLRRQDEFGAGELLDRTLNDTERLRHFIDQVFIRTCTNVVRVGYPVAMLFLLDPLLALIALSVIPVQWLIVWRLQIRLQTVTDAALACQSELTGCVKEGIDGAETVKALRAEENRLAEIDRRVDSVEALQRTANRITGLIRATIWSMTGLGVALIWWQGGMQVQSGAMTLGTLIVFTGFAEFAYRPFRFFPRIVEVFEQGRASLRRIDELLETPSTVLDRPGAADLKVAEGRVELRDVTFAYDELPVLSGLDVVFEPQQFTALVGRSGSGKTSLLRLLARLQDPQAGEILIDGQPLRDVALRSVRSNVAIVPQSPMIFSGTILDNLKLANPDASLTAMREACERAAADEFIDQLPAGWQTQIGRGGIRLSGGQAQRLAIAQALLRNSRILLLDEPTSALDRKSQDLIVETLMQLSQSITVVLVGHRVETFRHADQIVLLEQGEVVDVGTHDELLVKSNEYADLLSTERNAALHVDH